MLEIDGVRLALERPNMEAGDYISDTYLYLIDESTDPAAIGWKRAHRVASFSRRLNRNLGFTSAWLGDNPELTAAYNSVVDQLNTLNQDLEDIAPLKWITPESSQNWSGAIIWA